MRVHGTILRHWWQHALGLMFSSEPKTLIFAFPRERPVTLHMWFVQFPIDVLFLDRHQKIVEKKTLLPWQVYSARHKARFVVEMREGGALLARRGEKVTFI